MDAIDWIARRRHWAEFFRRADRVGQILGSDYNSALQSDPDIAAQQIELNLAPAKNPPLRGWTAELNALYDIADVLLRHAAAQGGVKPSSIEGFPRPLTARALVTRRKRQQNIDSIVAKATPWAVDAGKTVAPQGR